MFVSIFITCLVALAIGTLLLLALARRTHFRSVVAGWLGVLILTVTSGELAARLWHLPSHDVLVAEGLLVVCGFFAVVFLHNWNPIGQMFYGSYAAAAIGYLSFAAWYTVRGGLSPLAVVASGVLFLLEVSALVLAGWYAFDSCDVLCRARSVRHAPRFDESYKPVVSLQIAAYNEPPEMLIETIKSAESLDYPNYEIVVIDNNTKDESVWRPVEEYCRDRPRVRFVHVDEWPGFKAGALNLALTKYTDPNAEIVGVIDADYLLDPSYLTSVVGYFADENLAFVQTPQDYRGSEGDPYLTACYDAYEYFFATTMPSRNERNSIIFAGTMGLLRRSVIDKLGGWREWCVTEDSEASLRILKAGYDGLYVNKSFGRGVMPLTFAALKGQRFRWCQGGIQIVKHHWRDLMPYGRTRHNRLTTAQRLDYLFGSLQWLNDLIYLAFTIVLLSSGVLLITTGHVAIRPLLGAVTLLPAALIGSGLLRAMWALRARVHIGTGRALRAFANWLSLSWTVALACLAGLFRKDAVFLRTPKTGERPGAFDALRATKMETLLMLLLWGTGVYVGATRRPSILLLVLFAWQGTVYACAVYMARLNQQMRLTGEMEARRRTEWLRARRDRRLAAAFGVALAGALVAAALFGLLTAGGRNPGKPTNPFALPARQANDSGPLSNLVNGAPVAPSPSASVAPSASSSPVTSPTPTSSSTPVTSPSPVTSPTPSPSPS